MTTNHFERAIIQLVREMASEQLAKRVPDIPAMDYRRLTFCLIEDRIAAYKTLRAQPPMMRDYTESNFYSYF